MKNSAIHSCRGLFVVLLLAMFVVRAEAQAKTETAPAQTKDSQTKTEAAPQVQTEGTEAQTQTEAQTKEEKLKSVPGSKALGMSILGNQEAPTALVIVPWKTSELGKSIGVSTMLDDSRQPIDKAVFMRMLSYYEIRSEPARPNSAPTKSNAAQSASAVNRRTE